MLKLQEIYFRKRPLLNRIQLGQYYNHKSEFLKLDINFFNKIGISKDYILSALYLSSPFFLQQFLKYEYLSEKRQLKVVNSLDNYFNRMAFKAAPFGLFSVIEIMSFKNKEGSKVNSNSIIYPSNEWLLNLRNKIEKLQLDSLILEKGKGVIIDKQIIEVRSDTEKYVVYNNEILCTLFSELKNKYMYSDLKKKILNETSVNEIDLDNIVKVLLNYEILITNMYHENVNLELSELREFVTDRQLKNQISNLVNDFECMNSTNISDINVEKLISIEKKMEKLVESNSYINAESIMDKSNVYNFQYENFNGLNKILPLLLPSLSKGYQEYELNFIERFGEENRVSLLSMIEDLGYLNDNKFIYDYKMLENLIMNKVFSGNLDKGNVVIDDDDISYITIGKSIEEIHGLQLTLNHYKNIVNLDTDVNIKGIGSFEGRFKNINSINAINLKKLNYKSNDDKLNNILDLNGQISLHQIDVIYTRKSIRLIDNRTNKEITIIKNNMVNPKYLPNEINTIYELSNNVDYSFQREIFFSRLYKMPRVIYKNVVLLLASWNLTEYLKVNRVEDKRDFKDKFTKFVKDYEVPKRFIFIDGDNKRPMGVGDEKEVEALYREYKVGKKIILKEDFFEDNTEYNDEYVLSFINSSLIENERYYTERNIEQDRKLKVMNEGWLYLEVELREILFDSFLKSLIKLVSDKGVQFYYIKYRNESNDSLRIRFRKSRDLSNSDFNKIVFNVIDTLDVDFNIENIYIKNYIQEKVLFNQNNNFDIIEDFFLDESEFIINKFKKEIENLDDYFDSLTIQVLYLYYVVRKTGLENYIVNRYIPSKEDQKDYRSLKGDLLKLAIDKVEKTNRFYNANEIIDSFLEENFKFLEALKNENNYVVLKILHLSFNRIVGTDKIQEKKVFNLISLLINTVRKVCE